MSTTYTSPFVNGLIFFFDIILIIYIIAVLYKDKFNHLININPLYHLLALIAIFLINFFSWSSSLFFTIAYILTINSIYKNNYKNFNELLNKVLNIEVLLNKKSNEHSNAHVNINSKSKTLTDPIINFRNNEHDTLKSFYDENYFGPEDIGTQKISDNSNIQLNNPKSKYTLDSSQIVTSENGTNQSSIIQTNLLQNIASTQMDSSKDFSFNNIYNENNNINGGFVI